MSKLYKQRTKGEWALIKRAKVRVQKTYGVSEADAHRLMQRIAMEERITLVRLAQKILSRV